MARYMNDYDLYFARQRFTRATCPNRLALAIVVDNLREWADTVSDGWAYWQKPKRAADKAMSLIESTTNAANDEQERHDVSDEEMLAAVRPIKAFLTRMSKQNDHRGFPLVNAEKREFILRAVEGV